MPARTDIRSILLIGSGPIVIGQACEFDYSGTQAAKALRSHGYRVVLVNSNPATIMTDPQFADATYVEPVTADVVAEIIARERPDALLPTLGGQTALNVATELAKSGILERYGVEMIGAGLDAIDRAEDRGRFKETMESIGLEVPRAGYARSMEEAREIAAGIGFPVMIRPSFILGGGGTGIANDESEFEEVAAYGLAASPIREILVEESVLGWKEFELEVMRDRLGNAVVVCSIENLDPMGVHTGDSITVAPIQTLSDREYQEMRNDGIRVLEAIGVATGGSNVQFAVDPKTGRRLVIEMNPRVSRSSALASKATGFPIAKIAALLAVGFTLDEIANDITGATPASFEPALDYVVVKVPRFDFAKFPSASTELTTSMRSVGEVMAIGRTFPEALQKALRSLENGRDGLNADRAESQLLSVDDDALEGLVAVPRPERIMAVGEALRRGWTVERVSELSSIDPWFVDEIAGLVELRKRLETERGDGILREAKRAGFSDRQIAHLWGMTSREVRSTRKSAGIVTTFKTVDTCAAEFEAQTPYMYGTYEDEDEVRPAEKPRVVVLGSGPNRIGQGIEFDYCCVHAAYALKDAGYETVMVNCNPETVSTDYDTSDRLYFEPLTVEDVLSIIDAEKPDAVVVQLGGQTPLNLAEPLAKAGVPIAGTTPESIAMAEDREQFAEICDTLGILQPPSGIAHSAAEAEHVVDRIGLPVVVRPSFVLGGRRMRVIYSLEDLSQYVREIYGEGDPVVTSNPILIDRFLESAIEIDVDAIYDGKELLLGGIMEHVEEAGVHSGDSACVTPPPTVSDEIIKEITRITGELAAALEVRGLINIQFAVKGNEVFVLEANPRASRTVPFISKARGISLAAIAARVMLGADIESLRGEGLIPEVSDRGFVAVKEAVLPWNRFPGEDSILGPEMKSTGEVMGIGVDVGAAFGKALLAAGHTLPDRGRVFLSFADRDKPMGLAVAQAFVMLGFDLVATEGTARYLAHHAVPAEPVHKIGEGPDDIGTRIERGDIQIVVNTPRGRRSRSDGSEIRRAARTHSVPCITTIQGALAAARSLRSGRGAILRPRSLQEWHQSV
ncbi:MAG: carbamoyl-phosphate synthase large subunit [Acidimicrobiales bacterium]|jgi:carbamoyl-phosphate synthase large subunit|nr:carbamoyl-phosphate synthase large subunit [Acidimicrobiales bacterium]HLV90829.1 carbamoyl-phosphate synthase large subunit [Acidimicrobiia bacterium]